MFFLASLSSKFLAIQHLTTSINLCQDTSQQAEKKSRMNIQKQFLDKLSQNNNSIFSKTNSASLLGTEELKDLAKAENRALFVYYNYPQSPEYVLRLFYRKQTDKAGGANQRNSPLCQYSRLTE